MSGFLSPIAINAWINVLVYSIALGLGFGIAWNLVGYPFRRWNA